jgi:hypothetical protein
MGLGLGCRRRARSVMSRNDHFMAAVTPTAHAFGYRRSSLTK